MIADKSEAKEVVTHHAKNNWTEVAIIPLSIGVPSEVRGAMIMLMGLEKLSTVVCHEVCSMNAT